MFGKLGKAVAGVATIAAVAAGSSAIAGAATESDSASQNQGAAQTAQGGQMPNGQPPGGGPGPAGAPGGRGEKALTGSVADKVKKAALAKVDGGTVIRAETNSDGGGAYEAHVRKSDGSQVIVLVNKQFEVTDVRECGPGQGPGQSGA